MCKQVVFVIRKQSNWLCILTCLAPKILKYTVVQILAAGRTLTAEKGKRNC